MLAGALLAKNGPFDPTGGSVHRTFLQAIYKPVRRTIGDKNSIRSGRIRSCPKGVARVPAHVVCLGGTKTRVAGLLSEDRKDLRSRIGIALASRITAMEITATMPGA